MHLDLDPRVWHVNIKCFNEVKTIYNRTAARRVKKFFNQQSAI